MRMEVIKEELLEIKEKYGDEPKSNIEYTASDFRIEDTISDEDVIITISHMGYIKRTSLREYKVQNRGGKGSAVPMLAKLILSNTYTQQQTTTTYYSLPKKEDAIGCACSKSPKDPKHQKDALFKI